jgi:DNA (cytosine-5)-methyltransferase 1
MLSALSELGYTVVYKVLNARDFGVPQNRDRIVIVGNKNGITFDYERLKMNRVEDMKPFLDTDGDFEILPPESYTILESKLIKRQTKSGLIFCGYRNKKIEKLESGQEQSTFQECINSLIEYTHQREFILH